VKALLQLSPPRKTPAQQAAAAAEWAASVPAGATVLLALVDADSGASLGPLMFFEVVWASP